MLAGKIKVLNPKMFGFISQGFGKNDLFFHRNDLEGIDFEDLEVGMNVIFDLGLSPIGTKAIGIQYTDLKELAEIMLKQFDKIGLSSADVMSMFEDSIQNLFFLTDINLNFVSTPPSVKNVVKNQAFVTTEADKSIEKIIPDRTQPVFWFLLIFFLKSFWDGIVMPQFNDMFITPMVDSYQATQKPSSEKEKIIGIRKLTKGNKNVHFENSRFITGSRVNLRSGPSTKTEILAELNFGQVVTILQNTRDWVEISYIYENEILQGWVSKRYIGKFK